MNKISTLFLSIIFNKYLFSQDEIMKQILDQLSEKGNSYGGYYAEFSFNFSNKNQGIDEYSEGKIWIKEDMYKLNIVDLSIINNGETMVFYERCALR